jgi:hypothetical protein
MKGDKYYIVRIDQYNTSYWYKSKDSLQEYLSAEYSGINYHRDEGPAVERNDTDGERFWYKEGHLHREDGPAVTNKLGLEKWFFEGRLHRTDGPAIVYPNGKTAFYLHGEQYAEEDFKRKTEKKQVEMTMEELSKILGYDVKIIKDRA